MNNSKFRKQDVGKTRFGLVPPNAYRVVAEVLTYGAEKYGVNNWCAGAVYSRYVDALERHLNAWKSGENLDPESEQNHLAHVACCTLFLLEYQLSGLGEDDRIYRAIERNK